MFNPPRLADFRKELARVTEGYCDEDNVMPLASLVARAIHAQDTSTVTLPPLIHFLEEARSLLAAFELPSYQRPDGMPDLFGEEYDRLRAWLQGLRMVVDAHLEVLRPRLHFLETVDNLRPREVAVLQWVASRDPEMCHIPAIADGLVTSPSRIQETITRLGPKGLKLVQPETGFNGWGEVWRITPEAHPYLAHLRRIKGEAS